jgi:hypothetical protein
MTPMRFFPAAIVTLVGAAATSVACNRSSAPAPSASAPPDGEVASAAPRPSAAPNALPLPREAVELVVNPDHLPPYDGPTGSVEGTVSVRGPDAPDVPGLDFAACPAAIDTYRKLFRAGPAAADGTRPLADAVVAVTNYSGFYIPEKAESQLVTIDASCAYPQRTIAMTFGQRLEVQNDSTLSFAPYLQGSGDVTVMIAPPQRHGPPVKIYPRKAAYFGLRDRLETFVHGDVYVLRQPLHAVTDRQGHYRIDGVPVGKLNVGARLAAVGEATQDVTVRAGVVEKVDLVLTYAPAPPTRPPPVNGGKKPEIW